MLRIRRGDCVGSERRHRVDRAQRLPQAVAAGQLDHVERVGSPIAASVSPEGPRRRADTERLVGGLALCRARIARVGVEGTHQSVDRRVLEEHRQRQAHAEDLLESGGESDGEQGVPTQSEEILVAGFDRSAQQFGPSRHDRGALCGLGCRCDGLARIDPFRFGRDRRRRIRPHDHPALVAGENRIQGAQCRARFQSRGRAVRTEYFVLGGQSL